MEVEPASEVAQSPDAPVRFSTLHAVGFRGSPKRLAEFRAS